ncbi:MAG: 4-hydroxy-tetrahydrodipicolinate reductase [Cuniculiplasma sp.]|jgi:4-hydroxy-tetrahydrodipicolinate reductase|nr:4-hydroxy-tetrahydrodipicolinate reductase [Cuniculiplasma sp.]
MEKINVCIAGATGWVGKALTKRILESSDINLSGAVARKASGMDLKSVFPESNTELKFESSIEMALKRETDVLIDYTSPRVVKKHVLYAIDHGVNVVVGTSGLTDEDYREIEQIATEKNVGVFAAGNFAISAALLLHFSSIASRYMQGWEVIDYASWNKIDSPSGTALEIANRLSSIGKPEDIISEEQMTGFKESRGIDIGGTRVHSVRLPGFVIGTDVIFGGDDERLTIKFDAGTKPETYVEGTLMAARYVIHMKGLTRGLDKILFH